MKEGSVLENGIKGANVDFLVECILAIETKEECRAFLEDLCTIPEIKAMAQRAEVAKLLSEKKVYNEIVEETGASTATISRVNRSLQGGNDGYSIVFDRMKDND